MPHNGILDNTNEEQTPDFEKIILAFKAIDFLMKNLPEQPSKVLNAIKF